MGSTVDREIDIERVISTVSQTAECMIDGHKVSPEQQRRLLAACDNLSSQLKSSSKRIAQLDFQWTETTAIRIAIDMGVFQMLHDNTKADFTIDEIASYTGADPVLIERIMRSLIVSGLFTVTPGNTYKLDDSARALCDGGALIDMITFIHDVTALVSQKLPEFLASTGYRNPNNVDLCPFQYSFKTQDRFYDWLSKKPTLYKAFCGMMQTTEKLVLRWPEIFPASQRFESYRGSEATHTLQLVDIAGGAGHNLQYLLDQIPDLKANLILQDVPEVLKNKVDIKQGQMHAMSHDIFHPQPVKGADVYILRRVLHNWPDNECQQILGHIRDAMESNSILLIHERIFPKNGGEISSADVSIDLSMMMLYGSMERTEKQFAALLQSVGLELVYVWKAEKDTQCQEGVIEVIRSKEQ